MLEETQSSMTDTLLSIFDELTGGNGVLDLDRSSLYVGLDENGDLSSQASLAVADKTTGRLMGSLTLNYSATDGGFTVSVTPDMNNPDMQGFVVQYFGELCGTTFQNVQDLQKDLRGKDSKVRAQILQGLTDDTAMDPVLKLSLMGIVDMLSDGTTVDWSKSSFSISFSSDGYVTAQMALGVRDASHVYLGQIVASYAENAQTAPQTTIAFSPNLNEESVRAKLLPFLENVLGQTFDTMADFEASIKTDAGRQILLNAVFAATTDPTSCMILQAFLGNSTRNSHMDWSRSSFTIGTDQKGAMVSGLSLGRLWDADGSFIGTLDFNYDANLHAYSVGVTPNMENPTNQAVMLRLFNAAVGPAAGHDYASWEDVEKDLDTADGGALEAAFDKEIETAFGDSTFGDIYLGLTKLMTEGAEVDWRRTTFSMSVVPGGALTTQGSLAVKDQNNMLLGYYTFDLDKNGRFEMKMAVNWANPAAQDVLLYLVNAVFGVSVTSLSDFSAQLKTDAVLRGNFDAVNSQDPVGSALYGGFLDLLAAGGRLDLKDSTLSFGVGADGTKFDSTFQMSYRNADGTLGSVGATYDPDAPGLFTFTITINPGNASVRSLTGFVPYLNDLVKPAQPFTSVEDFEGQVKNGDENLVQALQTALDNAPDAQKTSLQKFLTALLSGVGSYVDWGQSTISFGIDADSHLSASASIALMGPSGLLGYLSGSFDSTHKMMLLKIDANLANAAVRALPGFFDYVSSVLGLPDSITSLSELDDALAGKSTVVTRDELVAAIEKSIGESTDHGANDLLSLMDSCLNGGMGAHFSWGLSTFSIGVDANNKVVVESMLGVSDGTGLLGHLDVGMQNNAVTPTFRFNLANAAVRNQPAFLIFINNAYGTNYISVAAFEYAVAHHDSALTQAVEDSITDAEANGADMSKTGDLREFLDELLTGVSLSWEDSNLSVGMNSDGDTVVQGNFALVSPQDGLVSNLTFSADKSGRMTVTVTANLANAAVRRMTGAVDYVNACLGTTYGSLDDLDAAIRDNDPSLRDAMVADLENPDGTYKDDKDGDLAQAILNAMNTGSSVAWDQSSISFGVDSDGHLDFSVSFAVRGEGGIVGTLIVSSCGIVGNLSLRYDAANHKFLALQVSLNLDNANVRGDRNFLDYMELLFGQTFIDAGTLESYLESDGNNLQQQLSAKLASDTDPEDQAVIQGFLDLLSGATLDWSRSSLTVGNDAEGYLSINADFAMVDSTGSLIAT